MAIEQHPTQVAAKLESADWNDLVALWAARGSKFWLYSISATSGLRFMFSLTEPLLSDIRSGTGRIAQLGQLSAPVDLFASIVSDYDAQRDPVEKNKLGEPMALALTALVVSHSSWDSLASDTSDDEKHVLVLDWEAKDGQRSAQATFSTPRGALPDKDMLIEVAMAIYKKHYGTKLAAL